MRDVEDISASGDVSGTSVEGTGSLPGRLDRVCDGVLVSFL